MSPFIFLCVLGAALLNASWTAIVKSGEDKALDVVLVSAGAGLVSAVTLPFLLQPAAESWPYLAASTVSQWLYYYLLSTAYRHGDMSEAYPLMRGVAPLIVATVAGPLIGETLTAHRWLGVALISAGALTMALDGNFRRSSNTSAVPYALANAGVIAFYTLVDGVGARKSGAPLAYTMWLFLLSAAPMLLWALLRRRSDFTRYARGRLHLGGLGGAATVGSYGVVLYSMTLAPVALIAALRETSILFAAAIAVLILGERISMLRYLAIGFIAAGAVAIRLA